MTKKEKIAAEIIYKEYKKYNSSDKMYLKTDELISKSCGELRLSDLHSMILHGASEYVGFHGASDSVVKISQKAIDYFENKTLNYIKEWVVIISSLLAAIFGIFSYFK
jgi:hypothetical protein